MRFCRVFSRIGLRQGISIEFVVASVATRIKFQVFWSTKWPNREGGPIIYIAQSRSPTLESTRGRPPISLEPGMTASFVRARARGSQLGLTTPVPWEKRGRTAPVKRDRCATKSPRILSCAERGTGLDHGEGEFSPVGPRDHGAGLVALSSLALSISVRLQGVPASHRTGFKTSKQNETFSGSNVPFCPILSHSLLFISRMRKMSREPERGMQPETAILHREKLVGRNSGREKSDGMFNGGGRAWVAVWCRGWNMEAQFGAASP